MSEVSLLPDIDNLDPDSLCYSLYTQLYTNFFNSQDKLDAEHPNGVVEGDQTSIRLKNTAYHFASAISSAVSGEGGGSDTGVLLDYVKRSGSNMTGLFRANYGFEAGAENLSILHTYKHEDDYGIVVEGNLKLGGNSLYLGNQNILRYDAEQQTIHLEGNIDFGVSTILSNGEIIIGESRESGVVISPSILQFQGNTVYHAGNANIKTVDWHMRSGFVSNELKVSGNSIFSGVLQVNNQMLVCLNDETIFSINGDELYSGVSLSFGYGQGIKMDGLPILTRFGADHIGINAIGGDLLLGNSNTDKVRLCRGLSDINGENNLISPYGAAYFPNSLIVKHDYGSVLFSTYRKNENDEGVVLHQKVRFKDSSGPSLTGKDNGINFSSRVIHSNAGGQVIRNYNTLIEYRASASLLQPHDRLSGSLYFSTDGDFICFDQPLEASDSIGIANSLTRLENGALFLNEENYFLSVKGGIKHYGNSLFEKNLSSEKFSSGFAGSGWAIHRNEVTGNIIATVDEMIVRKRMRVFEMEIQKTELTNGSLWVSNSCSGDQVIKL